MVSRLMVGRGLSLTLVGISVVVLGAAAIYLNDNKAVNLGSGASGTIQTTNGKLVKSGTPAFSPCKNVTTTYALIGAKTDTPSACTPLTVNSDISDPLIGLRVQATGTIQNGVFFATALKLTQSIPAVIPSNHPTPAPETSEESEYHILPIEEPNTSVNNNRIIGAPTPEPQDIRPNFNKIIPPSKY